MIFQGCIKESTGITDEKVKSQEALDYHFFKDISLFDQSSQSKLTLRISASEEDLVDQYLKENTLSFNVAKFDASEINASKEGTQNNIDQNSTSNMLDDKIVRIRTLKLRVPKGANAIYIHSKQNLDFKSTSTRTFQYVREHTTDNFWDLGKICFENANGTPTLSTTVQY
jgi:hypothetical protein